MKHEVVLCGNVPLQSLNEVIKQAMADADCSFTQLSLRVYQYLKKQNHVVIGTWRVGGEIVVQYWDFSGETCVTRTIKVPQTRQYQDN
jgi:hypothetical protein